MTNLDTEYVYLEMIRDKGGANYEVVAGLFKGLYKHEDDTYVLLSGLKDCTECLLLGEFDFLTIEVLEKDFRNMSFCTKDQVDQEQAFKIVSDLFTDLKEAGLEARPNAGIIDVSKYKNVPKEYLEGKPIDTGTTAATGVGTFSNRSNHYSQTSTGSAYTKTTPKADPEPAVFSRTKTNKPTTEDLAALSALLDQIAAGETQIELPATPEDDPADTASTTQEDDYDDLYGPGFMCG